MTMHHFSPAADPADISACVAEHGYAIVDRVADSELLDRLTIEASRKLSSGMFRAPGEKLR